MHEPEPRHGTSQHLKEARQNAFLAEYARSGNVSAAATAAGVDRSAHYRWSEEPDYAARFEDARESAVDVLEAEARRRAVDGWEEPVGWYKGVAGGTVRRYSDTLLIFLLKGAAPEKYRDKADSDITGFLSQLNMHLWPDHMIAAVVGGQDPFEVLALEVDKGLKLIEPGEPEEK